MADSPIKVEVDLTKPVTVLVEKVAGAVGILYEPARIKKKAKAEAEAQIVVAKAKIKSAQLTQRAMARLELEEAKKQQNMEAILGKALPKLDEKSDPTGVSDDWITHFFEKSRLTSDEEMQEIWASILAGETNSPGLFSKRTVSLIAEIEKTDAELFTRLAGFCWSVAGNRLIPLIIKVSDDIYTDNGITFENLTHLDAIGLIRFNNISGFSIESPGTGGNFLLAYQGSSYLLTFAEGKKNKLSVGHVLLTQQGLELMRVCTPDSVDKFENYTIEKLKADNLGTIVHLVPSSTPKEKASN